MYEKSVHLFQKFASTNENLPTLMIDVGRFYYH